MKQLLYLAIAMLAVHICTNDNRTAADTHSEVRFDIPPSTAAKTLSSSDGRTLIQVELLLSSMISNPESGRIDQWLVRCQPRGHFASIVDYHPRTEAGSNLASPIQVKQTKEKNQSFGIGMNGSCPLPLNGNAGLDHNSKDVDSVQFDRLAPLHAVTASGTINRGTGVYFKLRWTARQILEGQKAFQLTLDVPESWRTGLIDISVVAQARHKSFANWESSSKTLGEANFVIAVYREDDQHARQIARKMAQAEHVLRTKITELYSARSSHSLSTLWQHMTEKMDFRKSAEDTVLLERLMLNQRDPHLEQEFRKLPVDCRLAALDYSDAQNSFTKLNEQPIDQVLAERE